MTMSQCLIFLLLDQAAFGAGNPACVREFTPSMPVVFRGVLIKEKDPLSENVESGPVQYQPEIPVVQLLQRCLQLYRTCANMFHFS